MVIKQVFVASIIITHSNGSFFFSPQALCHSFASAFSKPEQSVLAFDSDLDPTVVSFRDLLPLTLCLPGGFIVMGSMESGLFIQALDEEIVVRGEQATFPFQNIGDLSAADLHSILVLQSLSHFTVAVPHDHTQVNNHLPDVFSQNNVLFRNFHGKVAELAGFTDRK